MILNVNGEQVYVYTGNHDLDRSLPTVLFVHGAANDHSVWALQSRYFAYHGWNVLAVDLPGHGKSGGHAKQSIEELSEWTVAFLDAAGVERCAIVGHSMGSLLGLETTARQPHRISHLAMVGTAVPMPVSEPLLNSSAANEHLAYELINAFAHSAHAKVGGNRVPGMWMTGNSMRLMERSGDGVLHADFTACNSYTSGFDAAASVKCPVLLILGERDQMTPPRAAREITGKLRGAKTVMLNGAGHSLMSEQPDAVLDALIGFLTEKQTAAA